MNAGVLDRDRLFTAGDYTEALGLVDAVKDRVGGFAPGDHDRMAARAHDILHCFGLQPELVQPFAYAMAADCRAVVTEAGGDAQDVAATMFMDGVMIGLALALCAGEP